jgi:glycine dehydrogenase subunit 2
MHEFVLSLEHEKETYGVSALDVAKCLMDYGIHPPTMYFPLIVHEALMVEPTETESKESLDVLIAALLSIYEKIEHDPEYVRCAPHKTAVKRLDEVQAARHPVLRYDFAAAAGAK